VWDKCPRVDWLLWLYERTPNPDQHALRLFACACVRGTPLADGRTVWDLLTDPISKAAVETAEKFTRGEVTEEELRAAANAAAANAANAAAAYAANAAANTAYAAAANAAYAAANTANAAYAAANTANTANTAANTANAWQLAKFRELIPNPFQKVAP
jgi:hypothetical protein